MSGADADWLRLALRRTEEARQRWRLRCVAAEAGLQALQALQAPSAGGPADEDELEVGGLEMGPNTSLVEDDQW
ncbi:unnamed protein product, partial [Prorocentrum cordatum]